jgi:hypothetical protein
LIGLVLPNAPHSQLGGCPEFTEVKMTHKYGTNIPRARELLCEIADEIEATSPLCSRDIRRICDNLMTRKQSGRRAPNTRSPVTQKVIDGVTKMLSETDLSQEKIAAHFNIDGGRVAEIHRASRRNP